MGAALSELASYFQPLALRLIEGCQAVGVPVKVIDTGRTLAQQRVKLVQGVSWTQKSKHLPQPPESLSEAIDVAPEQVLREGHADWDPSNKLWQIIGSVGEGLGLIWGGRWKHHPDPSHFEFNHNPPSHLRTV